MNDLILRLRALFLRRQVELDLDEELGFHIEMQTRKNLTAGMGAVEAKWLARIQFGVGDAVKEECRDVRGVSFIETLFQDIRYALRGFRRTPLFALTVVGTIALGLGWNTAVFTIFDALALRPLAVHDPYSLYDLSWTDREGDRHSFTWAQYQDLRKQNLPFIRMSAMEGTVKTGMDGRPAVGELVSGDFFPMLGLDAAMGRLLVPGDALSPGAEPVLVLSYAAWQNRFGRDPGVLGRKVSLHGHPFTIVGVAPDGFLSLGTDPRDFWAPITMSADLEDDLFSPAQPARLAIVGRLRPGVQAGQAKAMLTAWVQGITADRSASGRAASAALESLATFIPVKDLLEAFLPIAVAFLLVLLSACANVANMMLARALSRQREIGIRLSLGAPRGRLIRQLLTESVLLALPAAAVGLAVSQGIINVGMRLLLATLPAGIAGELRIVPLSPDLRVFGFMIGAAVASALLFGLAPALQATRMTVMQAARGDFSSDFRPSRLRDSLVVAQVTVCAFLLICSGVLLRGSNRLKSLDTGLRTRDVIVLKIQEKFQSRAIAQLAAEPGIDLLASTSNPPIAFAVPSLSALGSSGAGLIRAAYSDVSPEYFRLLDIPILRGRNFTAEEASPSVPVAILSETAARKLWPNEDALGQVLRLSAGGRLAHDREARVVGVAKDTVGRLLGDSDKSYVYLPAALQSSRSVFLARVRGDTEAARQRLSTALDGSDPGAVIEIYKLEEILALRGYPFRIAYWVSAAVGAIGILLTLSGIYGVLSYVVAQRTKEIGIRMAMGATTRTVIGLVIRQCTRLAAWGVAFGVVLAMAASKLFSAQAVINPFDRLAYLGGMALVLAACVCAAYFPARRAARVNPIATLRYD